MKVRLLAMAFGFFLVAGAAYAGPVAGGLDTDGDTVEDAFDNCKEAGDINPTQVDTDHNGCGDVCTDPITCDMDNNLLVGTPDFLQLKMNFGSVVPPHTLGDCNSDGTVGSSDFVTLKMTFGNHVGDSGVTTAQCDTSSCRCTPQ